jgi:hypothetical protein
MPASESPFFVALAMGIVPAWLGKTSAAVLAFSTSRM